MEKHIYFDNSATTKICPEALGKYIELSESCYGNPSSLHAYGYLAERELERSREIILDTLGAKECKVIFTSSGSEANNLAILGRATAKERYSRGMKLITTEGEHASVTEPMEQLRKMRHGVAYIPTRGGEVDISTLERELTRDTVLVSVMMVNNETGAVYDLPRIARLVRERCPEALFHVDATQGYMKLPFTMRSIGADLLTVSSHKIEGPKGVGALIVPDSVIKSKGLSPIVFGGGQELGLRSGTQNLPAIAAFAEAARVEMLTLHSDIQKMNDLRALLIERLAEDGLCEIRPCLPKRYAPHILNLTLPGIKSETMLHFLSESGIFVSSGSACSSNGASHASPALIAYGHTPEEVDCSIRVSFSRHNTPDEVHALADRLTEGLSRLSRIKR